PDRNAMVFRRIVELNIELQERIAQRLDAVFLAAGDDDQAAHLHPLQRLDDAVLVVAAMLAAENERRVVVAVLRLRKGVFTDRAEERPERLYGGDFSVEPFRQLARLRAEEQHALAGLRHRHGICCEGVEEGLEGVSAHGEWFPASEQEKARKCSRASMILQKGVLFGSFAAVGLLDFLAGSLIDD